MRPYIEAAFRHRLLVLTPVLLVPLLALLLGVPRARQAESTGVVWVEEPVITAAQDLASAGPALDDATRNALEAQAMRERLATEQFVLAVLDKAGLTDDIERQSWPNGDGLASLVAKLPLGGPLAQFAGEPRPKGGGYQDAAIAYVQAHVSVAASGQHLVIVRYTGREPEIGAALVRETIAVYQTQASAAAQGQSQAIETSLEGEASARALELMRATEDLASFDAAQPRTDAPMAAGPVQQRADLQSKYTLSLALYQTAAEEMQQARTDAASVAGLREAGFRLVDEPVASGSGLRTVALVQMLLLGVVLGAALASGAVAVVVWSDKTVRRPDDIVRGLGVPVLASLPAATHPTEPQPPTMEAR